MSSITIAQLSKKSMTKFRLQAKNFLFTWPQCNKNKEVVMQNLRHFFENYDIQFIVVCREDHKDTEGEHLHACISLGKRFNKQSTSLMNQLNDLADLLELSTKRRLYDILKKILK